MYFRTLTKINVTQEGVRRKDSVLFEYELNDCDHGPTLFGLFVVPDNIPIGRHAKTVQAPVDVVEVANDLVGL